MCYKTLPSCLLSIIPQTDEKLFFFVFFFTFLLKLIAGENDGIPMISNIKIREKQRMVTTNPWMLPNEGVWPEDHVFVSTPNRNYTNRDYWRFFMDIDYEDGW